MRWVGQRATHGKNRDGAYSARSSPSLIGHQHGAGSSAITGGFVPGLRGADIVRFREPRPRGYAMA